MDLLVEDAELVADAVGHGGTFQGRQRIEVAGRQATQAAVAETGFLLAGEHGVEILAELCQRSAGLVLDLQVEQVVAQVRAE